MYRQLWHALRQRVSALDELAMCTMRLRLRYPGEVVPDNQFYIVNPTEVGETRYSKLNSSHLSPRTRFAYGIQEEITSEIDANAIC